MALLTAMGVLMAATAFAQGGASKRQPTAQHERHQAVEPTASRDLTMRLQQQLEQEGIYHGKVDGLMGKETRDALAQYQRSHNLRPTGQPNAATLASLHLLSSGNQQQNAANNRPGQNRANNPNQGPATYQARNGAGTRPGWQTSPGAQPGAAAEAGPSYATQQLGNGMGSLTSTPAPAPSAPSGFFGYSSNMSNGFNAATGRTR